jgi:hypothetical protein
LPTLRYVSKTHQFALIYNHTGCVVIAHLMHTICCAQPDCSRPMIVTRLSDGQEILWPDIKGCEHYPSMASGLDNIAGLLECFRKHFIACGLLLAR